MSNAAWRWSQKEERRAAELFAQGMTPKQIAKKLGRGERAVFNKLVSMRLVKGKRDHRQARTRVPALVAAGVPQVPDLACFTEGRDPNPDEEYLANEAIRDAVAALRRNYGLRETGAR